MFNKDNKYKLNTSKPKKRLKKKKQKKPPRKKRRAASFLEVKALARSREASFSILQRKKRNLFPLALKRKKKKVRFQTIFLKEAVSFPRVAPSAALRSALPGLNGGIL